MGSGSFSEGEHAMSGRFPTPDVRGVVDDWPSLVGYLPWPICPPADYSGYLCEFGEAALKHGCVGHAYVLIARKIT